MAHGGVDLRTHGCGFNTSIYRLTAGMIGEGLVTTLRMIKAGSHWAGPVITQSKLDFQAPLPWPESTC